MSFERCNTNRTRLPLSCPLFRPGNTTSLVSGQDTLEAAFVVPYVCELRRLTFVTSSTPECHLTRLTVRPSLLFLLPLLNLRMMARLQYIRHLVFLPFPHQHLRPGVDGRRSNTFFFKRHNVAKDAFYMTRYRINNDRRRQFPASKDIRADGDRFRLENLLHSRIHAFVMPCDHHKMFLFR